MEIPTAGPISFANGRGPRYPGSGVAISMSMKEYNRRGLEAGLRCNVSDLPEKRTKMLATLLIVILVLMLLGVLPRWRHSRSWGYYPTGGVGLALLIVVILLLMGRI